MKISQVIGREIFDSRGFPTIECELALELNSGQHLSVRASVPAGKSSGKYEALELRDEKRLFSKGVLEAIRNLENEIGPAIIGKEPDVVSMDIAMLNIDGTDNKSKLGANAILAASLAILRAQAIAHELEPYELIASLCNFDTVSIPIPMFNFINGGCHANNSLDIQEFMVVPTGQTTFRAAMESAAIIFHNTQSLILEKGLRLCVGDEGGFAPNLKNEKEALDLLVEAIEKSKNIDGGFVIALDVAASELYNPKTKKYSLSGKDYSSDELAHYYEELISQYPIMYIEDPFDQDDWQGWQSFTATYSENIQIAGDDLFATNPERIVKGVEQMTANTAIIKPNQIGTVTETLQAAMTCKEYGIDTVVSHRSGETNDNIIVDIAMGTQSGQIKAGGLSRGERLAKYNRLLRIEDKLTMQALNGG